MAKIAIPDAVAAFIGSLRSVTKADWYEAEEYLGEGAEPIKAAVGRISDEILANPQRAHAFETDLATATKAIGQTEIPIEAADLVVKFAIMAIYAADTCSQVDYDVLIKPMRQAWATVPAWADLQ